MFFSLATKVDHLDIKFYRILNPASGRSVIFAKFFHKFRGLEVSTKRYSMMVFHFK